MITYVGSANARPTATNSISQWADPSKQATPEEWPTTLEPLAATLRNYVSSTLKSFSDAGVDLALVSLGNEIRHGLLWPYGFNGFNRLMIPKTRLQGLTVKDLDKYLVFQGITDFIYRILKSNHKKNNMLLS